MFHDSVLPSLTNHRFHPKRKDVRNHIYSAEVKLKFAKLDQANLDLKVQEWEKQAPDDHFFFRGYGEKLNNGTFAEGAEQENEDEDVHVRKHAILV